MLWNSALFPCAFECLMVLGADRGPGWHDSCPQTPSEEHCVTKIVPTWLKIASKWPNAGPFVLIVIFSISINISINTYAGLAHQFRLNLLLHILVQYLLTFSCFRGTMAGIVKASASNRGDDDNVYKNAVALNILIKIVKKPDASRPPNLSTGDSLLWDKLKPLAELVHDLLEHEDKIEISTSGLLCIHFDV